MSSPLIKREVLISNIGHVIIEFINVTFVSQRLEHKVTQGKLTTLRKRLSSKIKEFLLIN